MVRDCVCIVVESPCVDGNVLLLDMLAFTLQNVNEARFWLGVLCWHKIF